MLLSMRASVRRLPLLLVTVAAIGCSGTPSSETAGAGGDAGDGGGGGSAGVGGEDPGSPFCDCSVASLGCGSVLAEAASESGCLIPLLPDHASDLLACSDGEWQVEESCAAGCEADACLPVLPTVVMDELVVQSQVEPFRGDQPTLAGDLSVELVQAALAEEGFTITVDGWFGNDTADTYSSWQTQLGYSGIGANGIPGPSSLAELGIDRFLIEQEILVGGQTSHSGKTINQRTKDMVAAAEALFGQGITVTQGSYNAGGVSASAGTHDGGGTIDVSVLSLNETQRWELIKALRTVGFAAWLRTPSQGNWPYHIHAVAVGDTDMSQSARNQVADYYVGLNGLASHAADNTPAAYQVPFTWWEEYQGP
jgi:hypothetical protein